MASYKRLLLRMAKLAFRLGGDALSTAVFTQRGNASFNFGAASVVPDAEVAQVTAKVFLVKKTDKRRQEGSETAIEVGIVMLTETAPALDTYDLVTIDGITWNVVNPIETDGVLTAVNLTRER